MIDFDGVDVIVESDVGDELVRHAVGSALGVPDYRVVTIADIGNYPERDRADVVVVASPAGGQFAWLLPLQTDRRQLPYDGLLELVQRICDALHSRCLIPDDSANPFMMWLVTRDAPARRVGLVANEIDEDRYVILEV